MEVVGRVVKVVREIPYGEGKRGNLVMVRSESDPTAYYEAVDWNRRYPVGSRVSVTGDTKFKERRGPDTLYAFEPKHRMNEASGPGTVAPTAAAPARPPGGAAPAAQGGFPALPDAPVIATEAPGLTTEDTTGSVGEWTMHLF